MNYAKITKYDRANGQGVRVVLWVSGCDHHCKNCHNPETWDSNYGKEFTIETCGELIDALAPDYISGITFSGGDPLSYKNYKDIIELSKQLRKDFPNKTQWLWTGYTYEELMEMPQKEILETIDVLCDGKFKIDLLSPEKHWVGSSNQRVISVQKTLEKNEIVLYED